MSVSVTSTLEFSGVQGIEESMIYFQIHKFILVSQKKKQVLMNLRLDRNLFHGPSWTIFCLVLMVFTQ